jgi:hypothetical protein
MLHIGTEEYFNSFDRFREHLPPGKDDEVLILKGHLLIERLLERFHEQNLANPSPVAQSRLSFAQKLAIAAALRANSDDEWLWEAISALNSLRNDLAHYLPSAKRHALQERFLRLVEASPELPDLAPPDDIHERLHRGIFSLHDAMSRRVDT